MADLTQEAKNEIADAIRIARSDGLHVHRTYPAFLAAQEAEKGKTGDGKPDDGKTDGKPPPVKETPADEYEEVATLWGTKRVKKASAPAAP
jgi:hypothetical protein